MVDEGSIKSMSVSYGLTGGLLYNLQSELRLIGAPVDTLRLSDLYNADLSQYKMIVFANTFKIDGKLRSVLRENAKGKTYIWNYAAGILNPDFSIDNIKELTGFDIKEFEHCYKTEEIGYNLSQYNYKTVKEFELDFPLIEILVQDNVEILSKYPDGKILCAQTVKYGGKSILCTLPSMLMRDFRNIAIQAGCKMYTPENCTVYADNRVIGIFPKEDVEFTLNFGEYTMSGQKTIDLKIKANGAEYFVYD